jgi:hypothetical protein
MNQKILIPSVIIIGLLTVAILSGSTVHAQEPNINSGVVSIIAKKFGLNEQEVQKTFDEARDERYADMHARLTDKLSEAVVDGRITEDQKKAILEKGNELHDQVQNLRNLPRNERKAKVKEIQNNLSDWAKKEGIDLGSFEPQGLGSVARKFLKGRWARLN